MKEKYYCDKQQNTIWETIFGDATAASVARGRLIHHCTPVVIMGDNYRARENKIKRALKA